MRIIAGIRRGHTIQGPADPRETRPTSDLVREAIFNIIAAEVQDRPVLDLFAGTGALGLEALSRGATSATFVEKRPQNAALIRKNLATLRFEGLGHVVLSNVYAWASRFEPPSGSGPIVAFLDPPYRDYEKNPNKVRTLLENLTDRLPPGSTIVAEAGHRPPEESLPDPDQWDLRRYGSTHIAIRTLALPDEES